MNRIKYFKVAAAVLDGNKTVKEIAIASGLSESCCHEYTLAMYRAGKLDFKAIPRHPGTRQTMNSYTPTDRLMEVDDIEFYPKNYIKAVPITPAEPEPPAMDPLMAAFFGRK